MEYVPELPKIFLTVGVAVWVFTYFLGKFACITKYLSKENIAFIVGVIVIVIGICTKYFETDPLTSVMYGIIAIYITQSFHDKTIKPIVTTINNRKNGVIK